MAVTAFAAHTTGTSGVNQTAGTTASVTLTSGKKYYWIIKHQRTTASGSNVPTSSGWAQVANSYIGNTNDRDNWGVRFFERDGDGSTGTHTIDYGGQQQDEIEWMMVEVTGNGSTWSVVQSIEANGSSSAPTVTMAALADPTGNAVLTVAVGFTFSDITIPANYTQLAWSLSNFEVSVAYKIGVSGGDLSPAFSDPGDNWTCQGLEIQHAASASARRYAMYFVG